jgi:hypothetical protein
MVGESAHLDEPEVGAQEHGGIVRLDAQTDLLDPTVLRFENQC